MPRFVVLLHETPAGYSRPTHYDLMLENGEMLLTWALAKLPSASNDVFAERLPDHRPVYLDFEGSLSGDRGAVNRIDHGDFEWKQQSPDRYEVELRGQKLRGTLVIKQEADNAQRWRVDLSD